MDSPSSLSPSAPEYHLSSRRRNDEEEQRYAAVPEQQEDEQESGRGRRERGARPQIMMQQRSLSPGKTITNDPDSLVGGDSLLRESWRQQEATTNNRQYLPVHHHHHQEQEEQHDDPTRQEYQGGTTSSQNMLLPLYHTTSRCDEEDGGQTTTSFLSRRAATITSSTSTTTTAGSHQRRKRKEGGAGQEEEHHDQEEQRKQSARELTSLSAEERNRILESIHGVTSDAQLNSFQRKRTCLADHAGAGRDGGGPSSSTAVTVVSAESTSIGDERQKQDPEGQHDSQTGLSLVETKKKEHQQEEQKLMELEDAISRIQQKRAYIQAYGEWDGYVTDPQFRRMFLRAESFDAEKAAARLVSFMEEKLERFGPDALTRQLTIDDLSTPSKSILIKKGVLQLLSARDSSGRAILLTYYLASQIREELRVDPFCLGDAIFYLLSTMAEDTETQRQGIVTVCIIASNPPPEDADLDLLQTSLRNLGERVFSWCPLKCNAHHHWVYDEEEYKGTSARMMADSPLPSTSTPRSVGRDTRMIFDTITQSLGKDYRVRTRLHGGGSFDQYKNNLKTFGIPVDHLPFSMDGSEIRVSGSHAKWIQRRRQKEAELILRPISLRRQRSKQMVTDTAVPNNRRSEDETPSDYLPQYFDVIDLPGRHDICLGRGNALHQHSGNVAMRCMMEPLVDEYENATSSRRQELNSIILRAVHLIGGNFLSNKASGGGWFEVVADEAVVEKSIGGIFRSMISRNVQKNAPTTPMQSPSPSSKIARVESFHSGRTDSHDR